MPQYLGHGNDIRGFLQGFGGKGMAGGMEVETTQAQAGQNTLKSVLQRFDFKRMALWRAENQVVGIKAALPPLILRCDVFDRHQRLTCPAWKVNQPRGLLGFDRTKIDGGPVALGGIFV